jgi:hypothetical protein
MIIFQPMKPAVELFMETQSAGTLNDAKWSGRPSMFGVVVENQVKIFDLKSGKSPVLQIPHDEVLTHLSFNKAE